jgi:hypothetical protein
LNATPIPATVGWVFVSFDPPYLRISNLKFEITPKMLPDSPITTTWPTIAAMAPGRWVGRLCGLRLGYGFFTLGKLMALATIPVSLTVFCWQLMPYICRRYTLTRRRIVVQKGLQAIDERAIGLDEFDAIEIQVLPGQDWLHSGDMVFKKEDREVFRLLGVLRPDVFRQVCLKARAATVNLEETLRKQAKEGEPQMA